MGCCSNNGGCCSSGKSCCKTKQNKISKDQYDKIKKSIKDYKFIDCINEENEHYLCAEIQFEDYFVEIEYIDKDNANLENLIEIIGKQYK